MGSRWLTDLPEALEAGGVNFRTWPGWETKSRSSGGLSDLRAIGIHHDVSSRSWDDDDGSRYCFDNANIAPIGNLYLGRNGRWTIGAAGASNTQGKGGPVNTSKGPIAKGNGNPWFLSIEAANDGQGEPWPDVQIESYVKGVAALMKFYGFEPGDIFAHFEWSNPGKNIRTGGFRKIDPAGPCKYAVPDAAYPNMWNMDSFRGDVWLTNQPSEAGKAVAPVPEPVLSVPAASGGADPTGVTTDWSTVPLRDRRVAVMRILTQRYGYPVNGAAGVVGNLEAESGIIPNRVQQSKASTPMTSPDSNGVVTTWTAQQIMDRKEGQSGPKTGGIGLAQWTFWTRREGLFKYEYKGTVLGANILFDMDAQLDYLVHELEDPKGPFRHVDETLRKAGVTVDEASDIFLHDFEAPAVQDQAQIDKRRGMCHEALADYNAETLNVTTSSPTPTAGGSGLVVGTSTDAMVSGAGSATAVGTATSVVTPPQQEAEHIVIAYIAKPPANAEANLPWMVCVNGMVRYATNQDAKQAKAQGLEFVELNDEQYRWLLRAAGLD